MIVCGDYIKSFNDGYGDISSYPHLKHVIGSFYVIVYDRIRLEHTYIHTDLSLTWLLKEIGVPQEKFQTKNKPFIVKFFIPLTHSLSFVERCGGGGERSVLKFDCVI